MRPHSIGSYNGIRWKSQRILDVFPYSPIVAVWVFVYDDDDKPTGDHFPTLKEFFRWADHLQLDQNQTKEK